MSSIFKKFNEFINESTFTNNLKGNLIRTFTGLPGVDDITTSDTRIATYIFANLGRNKEMSPEVEREVNDLLRNPPEGLLQVQASLGYELNNSISFTLPNPSPVSTYKTLTHICSGRNVDSIRQKGLLASSMTEDTNKFKPQSGKGSFRITTYKCVFAVSLKSQLKKVQKFFNFQDPHVVTFKSGNAIFYSDPFFSQEASSSCFTFSDIPSEDIISIEPLR